MIRNDREYQEAQRRLKDDQDFIAAQHRALDDLALSADEVERAMQPALSFHAQLVEEVEWYERVRQRDFETIHSLKAIGRLLIAARMANGLTQQELAERLSVSQAQVSRDERNEYHGITVERAQLILDRLGEKLTARLDEKPLALAG
ncbi:MAG TPA: helix-turn-helix transcriptional regulator [Chloroflexota bacterium]|nr:helix-turn-helix transcriptional regulator [Chloroflexota bacterium]